ncbi:MAG: glucose 1-dehydrogenase [Deltaproteobacteria bacterium]|nr:glucose 1-dehydrogenase [Deltaproteobacteria bacterium]
MPDFEGKVVVVTGGAAGIGAASVRHFAEAGARVIIADIDREQGQALADSVDQAIFQATDVTSEEAISALAQRATSEFGVLDVWFSNAGSFGARGSILETSVSDFDATLALLVRSVFLGIKHAGQVMKDQGHGVILNTCSISANTPGYGPHIYQAAKAAVEQLTKTVALELAEYGIRMNCVSPGGVPTRLITSALGAPDEAAEGIGKAMASMLPMGRTCTTDDIAQAALFLCSDEASYITAQNLTVDGGEATGKKWSTQHLH